MGATLSGAVFLLLNMPSGSGVTVIAPSPTQTGPIQAYVTGAVASPDVYTLQPGSRVYDLIQAAGGALPEADMTSVNLAKRVSDEDQIHIPSVDEVPPDSSAGETLPSGPGDGLLDINRASAAELMALPGIGEVRSRAIVDYRTEIGRFQSIDQLMEVPDIGSVTFESVRGMVTVGTAP